MSNHNLLSVDQCSLISKRPCASITAKSLRENNLTSSYRGPFANLVNGDRVFRERATEMPRRQCGPVIAILPISRKSMLYAAKNAAYYARTSWSAFHEPRPSLRLPSCGCG